MIISIQGDPMKKFFLVSLALASSMAFAAEVDYSRCTMFAGVQLDHDGKVVPNQFQTIKSQKIDGNKEHIVFESSYGTQKFQTEVTLERDAQGRVVKSVSGGERPSEKTLKQYRDVMVEGAVTMAPMATGSMGGFGQQGFMTREPSYWVKKKKTNSTEAAPQESRNPYGGLFDQNYEMISLSKLNAEQAKEVGIDDVEELKRLRQQWKKDKRTTRKLRDSYKKVVERSSLVVPLGSEAEFDIQDGVCVPKSLSSRIYNGQSGQVNTIPVSSRERCEKIRNVFKRHERKIQECGESNRQVTQDYFKELYGEGGVVGGAAGGYVAGASAGMTGGMYLAGGIAGGMMGGFGGGMYGGYGMGGMYPGMMPFTMGADMGSVQGQSQMCEYMYEFQSSQRPNAQGSAAGSGSEVQAQ